MWNVYVGLKVMCIDDTYQTYQNTNKEIFAGKVYTIREIITNFVDDWDVMTPLTVRLEGVYRPARMLGAKDDVPFSIKRFRPLVSEKTMAGLRNLAKIKDKVDA